MNIPTICPLCGQPLIPEDRRFKCARNHIFLVEVGSKALGAWFSTTDMIFADALEKVLTILEQDTSLSLEERIRITGLIFDRLTPDNVPHAMKYQFVDPS